MEKGAKIRSDVIFMENIIYYTEPKYYYDDGSRHIYKFLDEDGNTLVWFSSKAIGIEFTDEKGNEVWEGINEGDRLYISATVKDVSSYKGEEQIVITRCKIEDIIKKQYWTEEDILSHKRFEQLDKISGQYEIKTVSYKSYKNDYLNCETVIGSFNRTDHGCFIDIIVQ